MSLSKLRAQLDDHGLHLRRDLGQNFLVDENQARRLVALAGVEAGDRVIEVGTGLGCLTRALGEIAERVVSIEIDAGLVGALEAEEALPQQVELIHADVLSLDLGQLIREVGEQGAKPVRFVANLPYSVATPLLRILLDHRFALKSWSVMLQREVADRLFAEVGTRDYGSFAVLHHLSAQVERSSQLGARCFFPVPKVDSTFLCVSRREDSPLQDDELRRVERVVRAAFAMRRKTISNCLKGAGFGPEAIAAALAVAEISPRSRAETVPPAGFLTLARALAEDAEDGTG